MGLSDWPYEDLVRIRDAQAASGHGWASQEQLPWLTSYLISKLQALGLLPTCLLPADELAPPGWPKELQLQLTENGHDVLACLAVGHPQQVAGEPPPGRRRVLLKPAEMAALRHFTCVADRLQMHPAVGLSDTVAQARWDPGEGR